MIIHEIELERIAALETENNPPVSAHRDAPKIPEVTLQRVQAPAWEERHILDLHGGIDCRENVADLVSQARQDSLGVFRPRTGALSPCDGKSGSAMKETVT